MERPSEQEADDALASLYAFVNNALDIDALNIPSLDEVKIAVATLIIWHNFDEADYEIAALIKQFEQKKAISYRVLIGHLSEFVGYSAQLRKVERAHIPGEETSTDDLF